MDLLQFCFALGLSFKILQAGDREVCLDVRYISVCLAQFVQFGVGGVFWISVDGKDPSSHLLLG